MQHKKISRRLISFMIDFDLILSLLYQIITSDMQLCRFKKPAGSPPILAGI